MRNSLRISALTVVALAALVFTPCSYGWDLCGLLGLGCGSSCGCGDCCDPACGCGCGGDCGCACEPSCACGCGCNGRQYAGQTWNCCNECGPPICPCTDCGCGCGGGSCGGGDCCEPTCGCDCGCGCEPSCGCGCGDPCGYGPGCFGFGFGSCCGRLLGVIDRCCCGCSGCSGEMYWSEWHNDPPCCHDPCDCYGNYNGGCGNGGYCEPYEHAYCPTCNNGPSRGYYVGQSTANPNYVARGGAPAVRGAAPTQVARRPAPAQAARSTTPAPARRVSANPNPWRGAYQRSTPAQPVATARPTTRGELTHKPPAPAYNTFQR